MKGVKIHAMPVILTVLLSFAVACAAGNASENETELTIVISADSLGEIAPCG